MRPVSSFPSASQGKGPNATTYEHHMLHLWHVMGAPAKTAVPTQFNVTQLVVASAVWANAISARGAHPDLSILLLNNASEQHHVAIG
jgi:hypothetical protein